MKRAMARITGVALLAATLVLPFMSPATASARPAPVYEFTTIDIAGAIDIYVFDVNADGVVVGSYNVVTPQGVRGHGFILRDGVVTTIDYPADQLIFTNVRGINPAGDIAGYYGETSTGTMRQHGFLLTKEGIWSSVEISGHTDSGLTRILPDGSTVGTYLDNMDANRMYGIVRNADGDIISVLDLANTCHESATPNGKTVVGYWGSSPRGNAGYVLEDGVFTPFHFSATSVSTMAWDISSDGKTIVGVFQQLENGKAVAHGYIAQRQGESVEDWTFAQFDPPGSVATNLFGCNAAGDLVGRYKDATGKFHGFLARPVER